MTIPKYVIERAIAGGWNNVYPHRVSRGEFTVLASNDIRDYLINWNNGAGPQIVRIADTLLDPLFWQALEKAEEWNQWEYEAHRILDLILTGATEEQQLNYWKSIVKE